jgi:uncharacterized repeat protein (TIGR01451 family)
MKRTLHLFSFLALTLVSLFSAGKASAQVTALTVYFNDSSTSFCNTPAPVSGFGYYGVTGTIQPNDSVTYYINYGDGTDTTYKQPTQMQASFSVNHTYMITGTFQISITITNTNMVTSSTVGQTYVITNNCSALTGNVWIDGNANCSYDSGESYLTGHLMKITDTLNSVSYYAYIDSNGNYYYEVPDNLSYRIELGWMPGSITPVCPISGITYQAVSGTGTFTNDFGYDCNSSNTDFSTWGWANFFRPGHTRQLGVSATTNNFCMSYPATVTLQLDPLLSYVSTTFGPAPTVSGQTLTWSVASLSQLNSLYSYMSIYCDSAAVLGDTLCNLLYISYVGVDTNTANDTFNLCKLVSNSYDPNDKQVAQGVGPLGIIQNGDMLSYLINFQNTGTDTAYDITIVDAISANLDINSFQLLESSDPVNVTILPGNVVNFRFEGIYLPDSNVNEPLSHGHVSYTINAKTGLADGTTINNTAEIYFDFNAPIITNTTVNTIDIPTSVRNVTNGVLSAKVYPNPANDALIVATEGISKFTAQVMDILGRPVVTSMTNSGKAIINTSTLANGMYILHIHADGKEMTTKINVQH